LPEFLVSRSGHKGKRVILFGGKGEKVRKDLGKLNSISEKKNDNTKNRLYRKYDVKKKGLALVMEELKQRVTAKKEKIKRYESRNAQFQQNRLFQNNQKRLFEMLEGIERGNDDIPEPENTNTFLISS